MAIQTYIIRLCIEGFLVFLGIIILNRIRAIEWFFIVIGVVFNYVALIYEIFRNTGVFEGRFLVFVDMGLFFLPPVFFCLGFICLLIKLKR